MASTASEGPEKLSLENIPGTRDTRVFIGGSYTTQLALLIELREFIHAQPGWVGVLAMDFEMARDATRDATLRLLQSCGHAVFDVTLSGGQFSEVERAGDYGIDFLLVCNSVSGAVPSTVSSMLPQRTEVKPYRSLEDLRSIVKAWLASRRRET